MINETEAKTDATGHVEAASAHGAGAHITSPDLLLKVWGALVVLTVVTVAVTWVDLGPFNLLVAIGIAGLKATLVALYFMHLRWDRPLNGVVFLTAILFVVLFIGITLFDTLEYKPSKIPGYAPAVTGER